MPSDHPWPSELRLRAVQWAALAGLGPALDAPLAAVLTGTPAERELDRFLRRTALGRAERAAVSEAVFGVGLWRRRLRARVGAEAGPRLLLAALLELGGRDDAEALLGLPAGALPDLASTQASTQASPPAPNPASPQPPPPAALADRFSLPDWLAAELTAAAGGEADALADALARPGPICLRANRARLDRAALATSLTSEGIATRPAPHASEGLLVLPAGAPGAGRPNLYGSAAWRAGAFELQDEGSQLVGALAGRPGATVLDACAGAGGKTLQLAAAVGADGHVHACDPDLARLERLAARAVRAGVAERVTVHGAAAPPDLTVDAALVDAPCSELGPLRRGPDLRWRLDPTTFAALPALQGEILAGAAAHLRPGGTLVYATCTFRAAEDEEVARAFERRHRGFRRVRPALAADLLTPEGFVRTWPHRHDADGFFAAVWVREG